MNLGEAWTNHTFIAFDTETTGQYPFSAEVCEIAAVKWKNEQVIGEFQTLIRPTHQMSDFVIGIHHITNEMVATAPRMEEKVREFHQFIQGGILIAHHAPFDLGFMALEFERAQLSLPTEPVICSSLLSRAIIPDSPNHRLQTLISHLKIPQGQAHRALDDAKACLQVALIAMERLGRLTMLEEVLRQQGGGLLWRNYSVNSFAAEKVGRVIIDSLRLGTHLEIIYQGGSQPGKPRQVKPTGYVRNPAGDYIVATDYDQTQPKRFYTKRISSATLIY